MVKRTIVLNIDLKYSHTIKSYNLSTGYSHSYLYKSVKKVGPKRGERHGSQAPG